MQLVPTAQAVATCAQGGACSVGDVGPAGGIVIYVGSSVIDQVTGISNGGTDLEAAPSSFTTASYDWCDGPNNGNTTLIGANNASLGGGAANTAIMVANCTAGAGNVAADYSVNGYSDWFLPSHAELLYVDAQKNAVGLNNSSLYWASTEAATWIADSLVTWVDAIGGQNKAGPTPLWPIRAFSPGDPLPATKLAITVPSVGTAKGVAFTTQPQITVEDASNNTVSTFTNTVTASVSAGGILIGTATITPVSGVALFTNLGVDGTVGTTYTITFSATGLTGATSTVTLTALAIPAPVPDPLQKSKITSYSPESSTVGASVPVVISGSFVETIRAIQINGSALTAGSWTQTPSSVTFTFSEKSAGTYQVQIFNGSAPVLPVQSITIAAVKASPMNSSQVASPKISYLRCQKPGHGLRVVYGINPVCPASL